MPQLGLVSQESVQKERINQNGYAREAFVVVKALPFSLELKATEFQFSKNTDLEATLLYDYNASANEPDRAVENNVHQNPLEFKLHVNSSSSATLECRIRVLSSQLQSLFRVKVVVKIGGKKGEAIQLLSHAIKVVSKPTQPKKEQQKKTATELIQESIERLQEQQSKNQTIIDQLIGPSSDIKKTVLRSKRRIEEVYSSESDDTPRSDFDYSSDFHSETESPAPSSTSEFEEAFKNLISSINRIPDSDRTNKIRKVLNNNFSQDLAEFVSIVLSNEEKQETLLFNLKQEPQEETVAMDNLEAKLN